MSKLSSPPSVFTKLGVYATKPVVGGELLVVMMEKSQLVMGNSLNMEWRKQSTYLSFLQKDPMWYQDILGQHSSGYPPSENRQASSSLDLPLVLIKSCKSLVKLIAEVKKNKVIVILAKLKIISNVPPVIRVKLETVYLPNGPSPI